MKYVLLVILVGIVLFEGVNLIVAIVRRHKRAKSIKKEEKEVNGQSCDEDHSDPV